MDESPNTDQPTELESKIWNTAGVGEIYRAFGPLAEQGFVEVNDDHKAICWVVVLANLLHGPNIHCVQMTVVGDNLSAHKPSALYTVFGAQKARH